MAKKTTETKTQQAIMSEKDMARTLRCGNSEQTEYVLLETCEIPREIRETSLAVASHTKARGEENEQA